MSSLYPQVPTKRDREVARRLGERMADQDHAREAQKMEDAQLDAEEREWRKTHVADGSPGPRVERAIEGVLAYLERRAPHWKLSLKRDWP